VIASDGGFREGVRGGISRGSSENVLPFPTPTKSLSHFPHFIRNFPTHSSQILHTNFALEVGRESKQRG